MEAASIFQGFPNLLQLQQYLSSVTYNKELPSDPIQIEGGDVDLEASQNRGSSRGFAGGDVDLETSQIEGLVEGLLECIFSVQPFKI
jgi:hypothetical protein